MTTIPNQCDLLIIGGGINGAAIARDAARRGLAVVLVEKADFAAATSSASSKLIHGGLRYLEHGEFSLVREALQERKTLLTNAAHLVRPLPFVIPPGLGNRPTWMLRAGLFIYDLLAWSQTSVRSTAIPLGRQTPEGGPLKNPRTKGFLYHDAWGDDARLVIANLQDAEAHGAVLCRDTEFLSARRSGDHWRAVIADGRTDKKDVIHARVLVNASGPFADGVRSRFDSSPEEPHIRRVKGSHLIFPALYEGYHAYLLQNDDGRVIFTIPLDGDMTLVGTTEVDEPADALDPRISKAEEDYLLAALERAFANPPGREDVIAGFSGTRPLYRLPGASATKTSRVSVLRLDQGQGRESAAALHVYGGKLTTHRALGEKAVDKLRSVFPGLAASDTESAPLPGGSFGMGGYSGFVTAARLQYAWIPGPLLDRLARSYGTRLHDVIGGATSLKGLGHDFGAGLTEREVTYLIEREWARRATDILWRRTKLGLRVGDDVRLSLRDYLTKALVS